MTAEEWFEAALIRDGNIDNAGDGTVDGPGECTCPDLPPGHDDAQCAAATWERVRT